MDPNSTKTSPTTPDKTKGILITKIKMRQLSNIRIVVTVLCFLSSECSSFLLFRPFPFRPIHFPLGITLPTTTTPTTTTAEATTTTTTTTPTPLQVSAGFITSQVFNQTGGTGFYPYPFYPPNVIQQYPQYGTGGVAGLRPPIPSHGGRPVGYPASANPSGYPAIGGLAQPPGTAPIIFPSGLPVGGGLGVPGIYGGGFPSLGGVASASGK